jgi:DNA mismatch repair protein MutS
VAGLPETVIARARAILADLERERAALAPPAATAPAEGESKAVQLGLFPAARDPLLEALAAVDLEGLTPLAALNLLADWQRALRERPS